MGSVFKCLVFEPLLYLNTGTFKSECFSTTLVILKDKPVFWGHSLLGLLPSDHVAFSHHSLAAAVAVVVAAVVVVVVEAVGLPRICCNLHVYLVKKRNNLVYSDDRKSNLTPLNRSFTISMVFKW